MQTKTTFTPGPWRVDPRFPDTIRAADGTTLFVGTTDNLRKFENARLIAAAPDLYAALDRVAHTIHWMDSDDRDSIFPDGLHEAIRAALRRARGEG